MGRLMYNDIDYSGSEVVELTQADYDALPSSKYYDDVTYLISDVYSPSSTKNMGLGECYSTTEKVIGCWIDGTPVYQKTWDLGQNVTIPNNAWTYLDGVTIPNRKFTITAICVDVNGSVFHLVASNYENDKVGIWNARNSAIGVRYITLKYTKTTDAAGSGNWTPEGVPAVHYDGTEKVIGTWFGQTLYQKTINFGAIPTNATKDVAHNISNLGSVVKIDGVMNSDAFETMSSGENTNFRLLVTSTVVRCISGGSWSGWNDSYVTIQYTKSS